MGKFFISNKAQMSAPFELLVAVIIMTFVVIVGTQMLETSQKQVCLSSVDREITEFSLNLKEAAVNRTVTKFDFRPDNCYNENRAISAIVLFNDSDACGVRCGLSGVESCFVFIFAAEDIPNGYRQKCIEIPSYTTFLGQDTKCDTTSNELEGYLAINPMGDGATNFVMIGNTSVNTNAKILAGSYIIKNVADAAKTYPDVCVFVKK